MDDIKVNELYLYTVNTGDLYRKVAQPIMDNLAKKIANGTYDKTKALIAWQRLADQGAVRYDREINDGRGSMMWIPKKEREEVAKMIQEHYEEELQEKAEKLKAEKGRKSSLRKPMGRFVRTERKASVLSRKALLKRGASIRRKASDEIYNKRKALLKYLKDEGLVDKKASLEDIDFVGDGKYFTINDMEFIIGTEDECFEWAKESTLNFYEDVGFDGFGESIKNDIFSNPDIVNVDNVEEAMREHNEDYVNDIAYEKGRVKEELEEHDVDTTGMSEEDMIEKYIDVLNEQDPLEWLDNELWSLGEDNVKGFIEYYNIIDLDAMADYLVDRYSSVANELATYDGEEIDLGKGLFAYRTN